jgi:hypothetical protein
VIRTLSEATTAVLKGEAARTKIAGMGMRVIGDTPEAFTARIERDYKLFGEVARKAKVQVG